MALISIIENFKPLNDERLLRRAEKLRPVMTYKNIRPVSAFRLKDRYSSEITEIPGKNYTDVILGKGDNICLDFGDHQVGRLFLHGAAVAFELSGYPFGALLVGFAVHCSRSEVALCGAEGVCRVGIELWSHGFHFLAGVGCRLFLASCDGKCHSRGAH